MDLRKFLEVLSIIPLRILDRGFGTDSKCMYVVLTGITRTKQHHPDKLTNPSELEVAYYVHLKAARDLLSDPIKRFAYDRFGPQMLEWRTCTTKLDYVMHGLKGILPYYIVTLVSLIGASLFGYAQHGRFWSFFSLLVMFVYETKTLMSPTFPLLATLSRHPLSITLLRHPPYLPFHLIQIARRINVSVFIAVNQIGGTWNRSPPSSSLSSPTDDDDDMVDSPQLIAAAMQKLRAIIREADRDALRAVQMEIVPFVPGDSQLRDRLKRSLTAWLVRNEIRNDPGVVEAMRRAVERRNRESSTEDILGDMGRGDEGVGSQ